MSIHSENEVRSWIVNYLSQLFELPPAEIQHNVPLERYGIDSTAAAGLSGDLSEWLGVELEPSLIFDYPTIDALTSHLAGLATA